MADDEVNNDGDDGAAADDFYSLRDTTDDYWRYKNDYNEPQYDDDQYYSTKHATSWLDTLLNNTTASKQGKLTPVQDVNLDNVLATFVFNCFICVVMLGTYELLRRRIPSVYSQRLMDENETYNGGGEFNFGGDVTENTDSRNVQNSQRMASANSLRGLRGSGSVMTEEEGGYSEAETKKETGQAENEVARECESKEVVGTAHDENSPFDECNSPHQETCNTTQQSSTNVRERGKKSLSCPVLEWCIPVYETSWSTLRHIAGLDAYFYLRYIRMCLKITAVSSFWAFIILCPVYATGGGNQSGLYYFSMANVSQNDEGRIWVPTFFCWVFTMYCCFCVRAEMMHYVELRMEFLGGEEEQRILQRKGIMGRGMGGRTVQETLWREHVPRKPPHLLCRVAPKGNRSSLSSGNGDETEFADRRSQLVATKRVESDTTLTPVGVARVVQNQAPSTSNQIQNQLKEHRYSLQVEKIPTELRSNAALFSYFNEMFPNQVHSAYIAMNVPDLDALSARRVRVCRRLEKSLAYFIGTGVRPTHVAGRPRCRCCGIESTPIDALCLAGCCFFDFCRVETHSHDKRECENEDCTTGLYETLPEKGECVDSILYYTFDLANCNLRMKKLQEEKFRIAETGTSFRYKGAGIDGDDWFTHPLDILKRGATRTAEGLHEEFEVSGEDHYLDGGFTRVGYGSISIPDSHSNNGKSGAINAETKKDHPTDSDGHRFCKDAAGAHPDPFVIAGLSNEDFGGEAARQRKNRYRGPHTWFRALLWRMGIDFLTAGFDEVLNQVNVVFDSITRPSMSSTGFVTFKTLTPVTVTTSAPLTYKQNPMEVNIAPEPRDLVWQNVQIDKDILSSRTFIANVLLGMGVLLWSIPLTLIQAWAKVENVALIPGLEWVIEIPGETWRPLVNGYLPVITLLGLILILPLIFQWVATSYEKRKTLSGVQNSIVGRYFYYQLANIYITVTAGALWTSLAEIIDHPQQLLVILGETLPKLAGYFISLLITKTLAGLPVVLLRMGALSRMMFLRSCFNKKRLTQRELKEVYRKQPIYYGWEYPTQFLVIIICFTYACITPFVLPVGAAYYFVALLVYKKQALYVYTPTYESGGKMFPQAVSKTLFALFISQLTFIGYTLIRKGALQIMLLAPLPFFTAFFKLFIQQRFVEPSKKLSLERAVKIDALLHQSPEFTNEAYQQPVLFEKASLPICDTDDKILSEVVENLDHLQNKKSTQTLASPSSFDHGCIPNDSRFGSCLGEHSGDHEFLCPIDEFATCRI